MARLGVVVVRVRQDHGVALHGKGLVVAGVDGAFGSSHDGARSVLESHGQSHHASVPGLVPDNTLVVLGDVPLGLFAPSGKRSNISHVLEVHSGALGGMGSTVVVLSDVVDLSASVSSSHAPVLDNGMLRVNALLVGLLTSEFANECLGAAAHFAIEIESVESSAQPDSVNHTSVTDCASASHAVDVVSGVNLNACTSHSPVASSDSVGGLSHVQNSDISVVLNFLDGVSVETVTSVSVNSDDVLGCCDFFPVELQEVDSLTVGGMHSNVSGTDDDLLSVDEVSGMHESSVHGLLVSGKHENLGSVLCVLHTSVPEGKNVGLDSKPSEVCCLSVM